MPRTQITAALLIALSTTATALSPDYSTSTQSNSETFGQPAQEFSYEFAALDAAVQETREDPNAICFAVLLPADTDDAQSIRDQWSAEASNLPRDSVFFIDSTEAPFILESTFIHSTPAFIAFRNGRPHHSRTGFFTNTNLHAFIALSLDATSPITNSPDQTEFLFESMQDFSADSSSSSSSSSNSPAAQTAKAASSIMLNLHALIHGPFSSTYSSSDLAEMTTIYNQSQLTLATLDLNDPSVFEPINSASQMAMKTWNNRTDSTFGIGIWFDLALLTGSESEIFDWIDNGLSNPESFDRVVQSLQDFGQPIASLLISNNRYEELAMTITSPEQISAELATASQMASDIAAMDSEFSPSYEHIINSNTEKAAAYHAALLMAGRDSEAWEVAQFVQEFAGPKLSSAALCDQALTAGVLTDRHAFLVRHLNQSEHASLLDAMNTSFAVVPGAED